MVTKYYNSVTYYFDITSNLTKTNADIYTLKLKSFPLMFDLYMIYELVDSVNLNSFKVTLIKSNISLFKPIDYNENPNRLLLRLIITVVICVFILSILILLMRRFIVKVKNIKIK
jgi:hypothetical protein